MKAYWVGLALFIGAVGSGFGQTNPVITSFDGTSGQLVFTEMEGATNYYAEQSATLATNAWTSVGGAWDTIAPSGLGSVTCSVPVGVASACFYRIAGEMASIPPALDGMVLIPAGTNAGNDPDFGAYSLTVSSFYMDRTEITKAQWDTVYNWAIANGYSFDRAGSGKASNHPVHTVNWYDCVKWSNARSQMEGKTPCYTVSGSVYKTGQNAPDCNFSASGYRLPTSAEWEYAARGGLSGKRFPWGDTITHSQANYYSSSSYSYDTSYTRGYHPSYATGGYPYTSPAGSFAANGYGLYDMSGNVWEWCWNSSGSAGSSGAGVGATARATCVAAARTGPPRSTRTTATASAPPAVKGQSAPPKQQEAEHRMLEVVVRDEPERSERRKAAACGAAGISAKPIDIWENGRTRGERVGERENGSVPGERVGPVI